MKNWNDGILGAFVFHLVEKYYSKIPTSHVGGMNPVRLKPHDFNIL